MDRLKPLQGAALFAVAIAVAAAFVAMMIDPVETRHCHWSKMLNSCTWTRP